MSGRLVSTSVRPASDGGRGWCWAVCVAPLEAAGLTVEVAYGWRLTRRSAQRVARRRALRLSRSTLTERF